MKDISDKDIDQNIQDTIKTLKEEFEDESNFKSNYDWDKKIHIKRVEKK